jgi:hypothetical protein
LNIPQSAPLNLTWAASAAGEGDVATIEIVGQGVASSSGARAPWVVGICQASLAGGSFALPPAVSARFEQGATAQLTVSADQRMTTVAANAQPVSLIARDVLIDFVKFSL